MITQDNRPIAFFSRKLSEAQQRYSATKIEVLVIVETLKEFKGMLWGKQVKVYRPSKFDERCLRFIFRSVTLMEITP